MSEVSLQSTPAETQTQTTDNHPESLAQDAPVAQDVPVVPDAPPAPDVPDWRGRALVAERDLAISKAIHAVNWLQLEEAEFELQSRAVQGEDGAWRIKAGEKLLTPAEAVQELASRKPEWVRAQVKPGTGALGSVTIVPGTGAGSRSHSGAMHHPRSGSLSTHPQGSPVAAGASGASGAMGAMPLTYAELLKPQNKHVLQEFIHQKSAELERMRAAHFGL